MKQLLLLVAGVCLAIPSQSADLSPPAQAWYDAGQAFLASKQRQFPGGRKRARNVILFIGDGMGVATVTAARIHAGQINGNSGEENLLSFEAFPATALSKTYAVNRQVSDSASTATAMVTGVKTNFRFVSMDETATPGDCNTGKLTTILEMAEAKGLATGVVSTTRLTHATPAALYAHVTNRNMERDAEAGCPDIASQLIDFPYGDGLDVALGGGYPAFDPALRNDGRNLIEEWQASGPGASVVRTRGELVAIDANTRRLLGLFSDSHMDYERERRPEQPSLTEMTEAAISLVKRNRKGFFLMIEGGRIDHGHHAGNASLALTETIEFSNAIRRATELVGDDTLIIVTADHSHVMTMAGYPARGNPILGVSGMDSNNLPYTTLGYGNGPGYRGGSRPDLTRVDTTAPDFRQEATVPTASETHGGEDVAVYAQGPGSQWINGVMEQNVIFHVMKAALRL
ncbi:MAG: alkaline phosphatase [Pseudomonadota bacterium]